MPAPIAGQNAYNAFIQPVIDRYGYVQNGAHVGGGTVGYGSQFDDNDFFRNSGQLGYNLTLGSSVTHELHVGYQVLRGRRGPDAQLERLGPAHRARRAPRTSRAARSSTRPRSSSRARASCRRSTRSSSRRASRSTTPSSSATGPSTSACSRARTRSTARACARTAARSRATRWRPGTSTRCTRSAFGKMLQPRVGVTWAYNGKDTVYASYARYNPAAQLAAARRVLGPQPGDHHQRATSTRTACSSAPTTVASSSGKLFVDDLTPRTINEFLLGTAKQFSAHLVGARSTAATAAAATSGRTRTTTRASPSTRRPASRASSTSRT